MSAVLQYQLQMSHETCYKCGVTFAMPSDMMRSRRRDKESFWCPNGHSQAYVEGEAERVRREMQAKLDAKERELQWAKSGQESYRKEAESTKRTLTATKGQLTKTKNRIAKGVCPSCNRQFSNLHRHMETKHPEFTATP